MNPVLSLVLKALVVAGLGLVAVLAGSPVVTALFRRADPPRADPAWPEGQPPSPAATPPVAVEPTSDAQLAAPALGEGAVPPTSATPAVAAEPVPAAAAPAIPAVPSATDPDDAAPGVRQAAATLRGGRWIGMLERLAVYAAILAGFSEGIAVVLAVKGLARYPELKATTSGTAERFIIGTFTSVLFAAASAGLAWWLIGLW